MYVAFIRTVFLFVSVVIALRIMGKRQIGEMQPAELVVTILISELASIPMQNSSEPILKVLVPIMTIIGLEVLIAVIMLKSIGFRNLVIGRPVIVIENGKPLKNEMKKLRLNLSDMEGMLRQKNIFNIEDVRYGIIETNGSLSVFLHTGVAPATAKVMGVLTQNDPLSFLVICDGKIQTHSLNALKISEQDVKNYINSQQKELKDIFVLSADENKNFKIITER